MVLSGQETLLDKDIFSLIGVSLGYHAKSFNTLFSVDMSMNSLRYYVRHTIHSVPQVPLILFVPVFKVLKNVKMTFITICYFVYKVRVLGCCFTMPQTS